MAKTSPKRSARILLPLAGAALAVGIAALMTGPMTAMEPRDLPIAAANLDAGAETPHGAFALGDALFEQLAGNDMDGLVDWQILDSQDAIDEAIESGDVYATLVIPEDFSAAGAAAQSGQGAPSPVIATINEGKHPMVSMQLRAAIGAIGGGELPVEIRSVNPLPADLGMRGNFLPMIFVFLAFLPAMLKIGRAHV